MWQNHVSKFGSKIRKRKSETRLKKDEKRLFKMNQLEATSNDN